jgi:hypothetical protein
MDKINRDFIVGFIAGVLLILSIGGLWLVNQQDISGRIKSVTHTQINKTPLKMDILEVFYPEDNPIQEQLAQKTLNIMSWECKRIRRLFEVTPQEMLSGGIYGFVFCDTWRDPFLKLLKDNDVGIVDNIICWAVVCEWDWPFDSPRDIYYLYCVFPYNMAYEVLKYVLTWDKTAVWFINGLCSYASAICWQRLNKQAYFDYEYELAKEFFSQTGYPSEIIDLSTNIPERKEYLFTFYPAEVYFIVDLTREYGEEIIPFLISRFRGEKITSKKIVAVIEEITGERISITIPKDKVIARFNDLKRRLGG